MWCPKCLKDTKIHSTLKHSKTTKRFRSCPYCNFTFITIESATTINSIQDKNYFLNYANQKLNS